ncbi:MAG: hypothetical protein ACI4SH_03330, partial [Candidatus Scatosoma sp.]
GFFTDEPQYYRAETPFPNLMRGEFRKRFGENVLDGLVYLFVQDERGYAFRQKYYQICNDLYVNVYYKKLYEWCELHNCKLTGHSVEENCLFTQMWGGAAVMPTYEYEHVPAIDCLCRENMFELAPKQICSVASQLNKRFVLTETFACCGNDTTPRELRSIAESQYFHGVNLMCHHLYPYSFSGQAKFDHPPVFGRQSNWFQEFKTFNDYFTKLGYIIGNTREQVDIAILHPMREIWLEYIRLKDYTSVKKVEDSFHRLLFYLRSNGVTYHFIDESILSRYGDNQGEALVVGKCRYTTVLIPEIRNISKETYGLLTKYRGKLCVLGNLQFISGNKQKIELQSNITLDQIIERAKIKFRCADCNSFITARKGGIGDFLFIKNNSMTEESHVSLENIAEKYCKLDLETLREECIDNEITLEPAQSFVLIKSKSAHEKVEKNQKKDITDRFRVTHISENYLVLDYVQYRVGGGKFSKSLPIPMVFEKLLRQGYKGKLEIKQTFFLKDTIPLTLMMEQARYKSVSLNGKLLTFTKSSFDINFIESVLDKYIRIGKNELVYSLDFWQHEGVQFALFNPLATESLRNCLYFDTSIDNTYLKGDFVVNTDMSLSKRKEFPPITNEKRRRGDRAGSNGRANTGRADRDCRGNETVVWRYADNGVIGKRRKRGGKQADHGDNHAYDGEKRAGGLERGMGQRAKRHSYRVYCRHARIRRKHERDGDLQTAVRRGDRHRMHDAGRRVYRDLHRNVCGSADGVGCNV